MNYLIVLLATISSFVFNLNTVSAQSLAEITGEETSLWNALASINGVEATEWTTAEFRAAARRYATSIGLEYTNNPENGWNNIEILHSDNPTNLDDQENRKYPFDNTWNNQTISEIQTFGSHERSVSNADSSIFISTLEAGYEVKNIEPVEIKTIKANTLFSFNDEVVYNNVSPQSLVNTKICDCSNFTAPDEVWDYAVEKRELGKSLRKQGKRDLASAQMACFRASMKYREDLLKDNKVTKVKKNKKPKRRRVRMKKTKGKSTGFHPFRCWFTKK